jgi:hypothetical protein
MAASGQEVAAKEETAARLAEVISEIRREYE